MSFARWDKPRTIDLDWIQLNTSFEDGTAEGRLQWNSDDGTLEYGMPGGNVNLQVGQEQLVRVRNVSGFDIEDGKAVYITGAQANRPTIDKAKADSITTSGAVGLTTEPIDNNSNGYVCTAGLVRDIDTSSFAIGNLLWLDASTAGEVTATQPNAPNRATVIGFCLNSDENNGIIAVRAIIIPGMMSASDVYTETPSANQHLEWIVANSRFELSDVVGLPETTTPSAVDSVGKIYAKADNKLYFQDGAGTEYTIDITPV